MGYKQDVGIVGAALWDMHKGTWVETHVVKVEVPCKYISTFFYLREVPAYLQALSELQQTPDCCLIDGHGIAHPYFAGSATIFGVLSDLPTIGVAKKPMKGFKIVKISETYSQIYVKGRFVGLTITSKGSKRPIFISPGNRITITNAWSIVMSTLQQESHLPKPLVKAHQLASSSY